MLFTIHSAECENITYLYINVSDRLKENLYTCSINEQMFTVRQKTKLFHGQSFNEGGNED